MSLKEAAVVCDGTLADADPDAIPTSVVIDSRVAEPGALFAALPGERTDGHDHVGDAVGRGAVAALVARDVAAPRIVVGDVLAALRALADAVRRHSDATTIAITGSSGKTGTKEMVAAGLRTARRVTTNPGNFNNEIGVPMTILGVSEDTQALVVEIGADRVGDIAALMPLVRASIGIVTNVGSAHVGRFGSVEAIERAKGELVEGLPAGGTAVLNADDPAVMRMASRTPADVLTFGLGPAADVRAEGVVLDPLGRARFRVVAGEETADIALSIPGEHMVPNALAALAACRAAGVGLAQAAAGVASCTGTRGRMTLIEAGGRLLIDDSYNANPESMAAALKALVAIGRGRPTWAVLGYMAELGDDEVAAHDRIGRLAVRLGVGNLVVVGPGARAIHEAARLEGMFGGETHAVADVPEAIALLREELEPDAVVLVKASRSAALDRIVAALGERV